MGTAQQIYVDFNSFYEILYNKDIPETIYWYNETASTKNKIGFFFFFLQNWEFNNT